jgi:hypothetical protein
MGGMGSSMKRLTVVVLIALTGVLAMSPVTDAGGGRSKVSNRKVIRLYDYTGPEWEGVFYQTVQEFRAVMPRNRPRLKYVRGEHRICAQAVKTCEGLVLEGYAGFASVNLKHLGVGHIMVVDGSTLSPAFKDEVACHEMMHIMTGIEDNYGALPDQSCVWGSLTAPGPFDIEKLREVWGEKPKKKRRH